MKVVLVIAGSDSGGGAGVQADLKSLAAHGTYGATVITTITAQNTREVRRVQVLAPEMVAAQFDAVVDDMSIAAVKTGLLGSPEVIAWVAMRLAADGWGPRVIDPVLMAGVGDVLSTVDLAVAYRTHLLPHADLLTPNADEAARLLGGACGDVATLSQAYEAARALGALGSTAVLVKGGHLQVDDAVDVLWDGEVMRTYRSPRLAAPNGHGTGCTYASAITARLALGEPLDLAVGHARAYLMGALAKGLSVGGGPGPTDHFFFEGDVSRRGWRGTPLTAESSE
jgi:hydroxymethylpyrimidine/phosphomethylpyrimidine kinase